MPRIPLVEDLSSVLLCLNESIIGRRCIRAIHAQMMHNRLFLFALIIYIYIFFKGINLESVVE